MDYKSYNLALRLVRTTVDYLESCYPQHSESVPISEIYLERFYSHVDDNDKLLIEGVIVLYEKIYQYEAENYEKLR